MATTQNDVTTVSETCSDCGQATPHAVEVRILVESTKRENAEFSREPYRVSECQHCGETTRIRMNNA